jgi:hypothetical protein
MRKLMILALLALSACTSADEKDLALDKRRCEAYGLRADQVPTCVMQRDMQREKLAQQRLTSGVE